MASTIRTIASTCRLAPSTVRNILSSPGGRYSAQTREQVLRVAADCGYLPSRLPRALRQGAAAPVGILVRRLADSYDMELLDWHIAHLAAIGLDAIVETGEWASREEALHKFNAFMSWGFRAVLLSSFGEIGSADLRRYAKSTLIVTPLPQLWPEFCSVSLRRQIRERLTVHHLKDLGHRRIAILGSDMQTGDTARKIAALQEEIRAQDLAFNPATIMHLGFPLPERVSQGGLVAAKVFALARDFASRPRHERPSAVVAIYDGLAYWFVIGLIAAGCRVPEDVSVITYNETVLAQTSIVPLTTIGIAPEIISGQIVKLVQEGLAADGGPERFVKHIEVKPRLTIRASTGNALY